MSAVLCIPWLVPASLTTLPTTPHLAHQASIKLFFPVPYTRQALPQDFCTCCFLWLEYTFSYHPPKPPLILQPPSSLNSALLYPSQRPPSSCLQVPCLKSTSPGILCPLLRFVCVSHTYHDQSVPVRAISTSINILRYDD